MSGSDQRLTVPQVARLLGISERGVRDKIERGQLRAEKEGKRWIVLLPPDDAEVRGSVSGSGAVADAVVGGSTPAEVERAIEATAGRYMADFAGLYDRISAEVAERYEQTIAAKDETIAELRRRAEVAEVARDALRAQASPQPPSATPTPGAHNDTPEAPGGTGGFWGWVRRAFGGQG